jgi:hypothetical protein
MLSKRGHPIVGSPCSGQDPILTVELYCKWYGLQLLRPDGTVEEVAFPEEGWAPEGESAYCDHVPNPKAVARFAEHQGYLIDLLAMELMVGRWELEVRDTYPSM